MKTNVLIMLMVSAGVASFSQGALATVWDLSTSSGTQNLDKAEMATNQSKVGLTTTTTTINNVGNTYQQTSGALSVTASAWSNTGQTSKTSAGGATSSGSDKIESAYLGWYSGNGYGDKNRDATQKVNSSGSTTGTSIKPVSCANQTNGDCDELNQPEHSVDNNQRNDMVLFNFKDALSNDIAISLSQVTLGWSSNDADITVLAYTGSNTVGDNNAANNTSVINGKTYAELTGWNGSSFGDGAGWTLISHYNNTATGDSTDVKVAISTTIHSSYWLIGAYNPLVGSPSNTLLSAIDYVKIGGLTGSVCTTGSTSPGCGGGGGKAPEPATLALLGLGLLGMTRMRRLRKPS